ncbi:MAG: hypothetical protein ACOX5R_08630 [bacterium]|jgi:hypothetical protein
MRYSEYKKNQSQHLRCVICGHRYAAKYDQMFRNFPVYHPVLKHQVPTDSCEHIFYRTLLRVYEYIHQQQKSVTLTNLINEFDWHNDVLMKRDMLTWSISVGYLALDNLRRIIIPEPLYDIANDIFAFLDWDNDYTVQKAVDMLRCALLCYYEELERVDQKDMIDPVNTEKEPKKVCAESTETETKPPKSAMVTVERTGAIKYSQRRERVFSQLRAF